jgi:YfiH family protein
MWTLDRSSSVPHWRTPVSGAGAALAFSTRRGGHSAPPYDSLNLGRSTADAPERVAANREAFLRASLATSPAGLATAGQVHGARVVEVTAPGHHPECDALVTRIPDVVLAVTTADCMSLLYVSPHGVAAAHAGWRGTDAGIPVATLEALCMRSKCAPGDVAVHIGPCIRGCCYEVGDEVAALFPAEALRAVNGRARLDLPTVARMALRAAGVPVTSIHDTGACSACEPHWYFSHRRDAGLTGRMWGVAMKPGIPPSRP